jgi:hypothetical protein
MPDYSKIHDLVSHRIALEYDTGAKVIGMLASCLPASGPVEFVVIHNAKLYGSKGQLVAERPELTLSPNAIAGVSLDEGPSGRDVRPHHGVR